MRIIVLLLFFLWSPAPAITQGNLYSDEISVYLFMGEDCRICQYYSLELKEIFDTYNSDTISFVGLFPNRYSTEDGIKAFKEKHQIPFVLKREYFQSKTKEFGVEVTPEVVVYDEIAERILYKGRIDDSYVRVGRRQRVVQNHELREALMSIKNNLPIIKEKTEAIGCFITLEDN